MRAAWPGQIVLSRGCGQDCAGRHRSDKRAPGALPLYLAYRRDEGLALVRNVIAHTGQAAAARTKQFTQCSLP